MIRAAHARGIRVIGATILPFKAGSHEPPADFASAEAIRQAVNHWILTSGQYDAVADFAAAVADPTDPQQLNPAYNSGDSLTPTTPDTRRSQPPSTSAICDLAPRRADGELNRQYLGPGYGPTI